MAVHKVFHSVSLLSFVKFTPKASVNISFFCLNFFICHLCSLSKSQVPSWCIETLSPSFLASLRQKAALTNHLIFNLRCKSESLTPKSLRVRPLVKTTTGRRIAEKTSRLFLQEWIRVNHHEKQQTQDRIDKLNEHLKSTLSEDDYQRIHQMSTKSAEGTFQRSKERHLKKLEQLRLGQRKWMCDYNQNI